MNINQINRREYPIKVYTSDLHTWEYFRLSDLDKIEKYCNHPLAILFEYERDYRYYEKLYVNECLHSWTKAFPGLCFVSIMLTPEVLALTEWSKLDWAGNKKYPTDSLRIYFCNCFSNCFYCDTDVFLAENFKIRDDLDCFVIDTCSGTFLYNREKNNKCLQDFLDFYNEEAKRMLREEYIDENTKDYPWFRVDHGDVRMYDLYRSKMKDSKYITSLASKDFEKGTFGHFSNVYQWTPQCQCYDNFNIYFGSDIKDEKNVVIFPKESKWAFLAYCLDHLYKPNILEKAEKTSRLVLFE